MSRANRWQEWDNGAATTDVDRWLALYADDDNTFWATDSGHIQNIVDELLERLAAEYQRGREDAARDAEINSRKPSSSRETMIVAARGDGAE